MQLPGTNNGGLSTLLLLALLVFTVGTLAMPNTSPQDEVELEQDGVQSSAMNGWELTRWTNKNGKQCKNKEGTTGSRNPMNCQSLLNGEVNAFSFSGNGQWKLCLYGNKECKKQPKMKVDGGNVKCKGIDGGPAKGYRVVRKNQECSSIR